MTHLSDLKIVSSELEEASYVAFARGLGLPHYESFDEMSEAVEDEFQVWLNELKREVLSQDVNPLMGAASSLFAQIFQLEQLRYRVEAHALQQTLVNRVKCFAFSAKEVGYHPQIVMAARYLLCAWIDEYLDASPLGKEKSWLKDGLLRFFRFESTGDRFFFILKRCLDHSQSHVDLLELIYFCLSFGFKGPYRHRPEGQKDLAIIIDHLYHYIRSIRGEFSKSLSIGEPNGRRVLSNLSTSKSRIFLFPFLLGVVALTAVIIINHQLGEKLSPLLNKLSQLVS